MQYEEVQFEYHVDEGVYEMAASTVREYDPTVTFDEALLDSYQTVDPRSRVTVPDAYVCSGCGSLMEETADCCATCATVQQEYEDV